MSSSRPKKPNEVASKEALLECPSCGNMSMVFRHGTAELLDGLRVANVDFWRCATCGEEAYGSQTMKTIRAHRHRLAVAA